MDAIALTVVFKGLGMLLVIGGGIWIARYGYNLYIDGAGHGRDQAAFEIGKVRLKANSVGSVVMSTAFLWAWAGVMLSPNMDKKGDSVRIYSLQTPEGELEAVSLTTNAAGLHSAESDPEALKALLSSALADYKRREGNRSIARLDGKPAVIDKSHVVAVQNVKGGTVYLKTSLKVGDQTAALAYEPRLHDGHVTFIPTVAVPQIPTPVGRPVPVSSIEEVGVRVGEGQAPEIKAQR